MTDGQARALDEVREVAAASGGSVSLVAEPTETNGYLCLDTSSLERVPEGFPLRARERFVVFVPAGFPFVVPTVTTPHTRFAGRPHVQWSRQLCLYLAPDVEWLPGDGMYGYVERLWTWLERGALDQLDPVGGAIHPPTTSSPGNGVHVVVRADTPTFTTRTWTGLGRLRVAHDRRIDVVGWADAFPAEPVGPAAAVLLLSEPMPWEYPRHMGDLLRLLANRGIPREFLLLVLLGAARQIEEGEPLYVLIGTPMRGVRGGDLRQHLTAWRLDSVFAQGVRLVANKYEDNERVREIGEEVEAILMDWAGKAEVSWCRVLEDRPEIVTRRDHSSPTTVLQGKTVAVWGCGALGGHVALHLARAGVGRIILRDSAIVTPGVLVRQPYDDADVGTPKVEALAAKLRAIRPSNSGFEVTPLLSDVLSTALNGDDWTDGADLVFDCTASRSVRVKLEKVRKDNPGTRADLVSMIVSREATYGLVVVAAAKHTGGPADVYRRAKIDACWHRANRHFVDAFYPQESDENLFQPEPGCSSPTFVGSSADAAALSALLLNVAASDLTTTNDPSDKEARLSAWAHFVAQPHALINTAQHASADFTYLPDVVTQDPRRDFEVRTSPRAWEQMERWVARSRDAVGPEVETGGLSFGERDDAVGVVWITEVDGPPPDSVARPDFFECGTVGTQQAHLTRELWSRGSVRYVGMWHTHPISVPLPSPTDLQGMRKILTDGVVNPSMSVLSILGTPHTHPCLGTFVFNREDVRSYRGETYQHLRVARRESPLVPSRNPKFGLALSGGGSRAIAFHLGCLRALHDQSLLDEVGVLSAVSGGAVLAAMYAYSDDDFDSFEQRVRSLLRRGLQQDIVKAMFKPEHFTKALGTNLVAGSAATAAQVRNAAIGALDGWFGSTDRSERSSLDSRISPPFLRWTSRTTAFESVLRERLFGNLNVKFPSRKGLDIVLNATELRTGTAFRFGSQSNSSSRYGFVQDDIQVATAVTASAAYPVLLPALHKKFTVEKKGKTSTARVVLTDGGVYDNLGTNCLDPTRDPDFAAHTYPCSRIIACNAGQGQWDGSDLPYGWPGRMRQTVVTALRRVQDQSMQHLFSLRDAGELESVVLPYLGQQDEHLHRNPRVGPLPENFITRKQVVGYPTDFRAMRDDDFERLSRRGEQLTHLLLEAYWQKP